jgi:WD40 repeat protein
MFSSNLLARIISLAVAVTVVLLLDACGGGGSGSGNPNPEGGGINPGGGNESGGNVGGGNGATQAILNPGLTGKLFMTSPEAYIEFDLATGLSRILRGKDGSMSVAADGQEFALVNSRPSDQSPSSSLDELVFFGRDGRQSGRFLKEDGFGGRPLISPDKQTVLVEWHSIDLGDAGGVAVPTVFKRDGSVVRRFTNYNGYTWLPDGRILLVRGDSIYVTDLKSSSPTLLRRFPNNAPVALTPSPDGQRIAFALNDVSGSTDVHAYIMNVDGTGLRQVTTSRSDDTPADFSPDGQSLLVGQGRNFALVGPGFAVAGCAELFVVPLNVNSVINLDPDAPAAPALKLREVIEDTGEIRSKVCGFTKPSWRNITALEAFAPGAAIVGSGLNRGLSGVTYYGFAGDLFRTDLLNGETTKLTKAPNTPFPSLDGTEIVLFDRFLTSATSGNEAVLFLNSNGVQQRRIDYFEGFTGPLKFSPDKTKIAADWHNIDRGDAGGARIVTIFARDFSRQIQRFEDFSGFEWLPDGRLLLSSLNELWIAPTSLNSVKKIATFSDPIGGLALSRDGQKLAFNMLGNIWTLALSGGGVDVTVSAAIRLTDSARLLAKPEFSPDGKVILVKSLDSPNQVWAVPADGQRVPVMSIGQLATSAFALKRVDDGSERLIFPGTSVWWR